MNYEIVFPALVEIDNAMAKKRDVDNDKSFDMDIATIEDLIANKKSKAYPELLEKQDYIKKVISMEEERFHQTLESGLVKLDEMLNNLINGNEKTLCGEDAFKLYDTYGFPIDLTVEILNEKGLNVDTLGFENAMKEQKLRAKKARSDANIPGWDNSNLSFKELPETVFNGYEEYISNSKVIAIIKENEFANEAFEGDRVTVISENSPFYAESGGQIGDIGTIKTDKALLNVIDVKKSPDGKFLHICDVEYGMVSVNEIAEFAIDTHYRKEIMGAHSSVHLVHEALRKVLGTHVQQAGSLVEPNKIRFDFTHFSAVAPEELNLVEDIVNDEIRKGISVTSVEMPISQAKELGATALFGEKYGLRVRVVQMGDFSIELCGGTHIDNTAKIGMFKITSESSVAAGVRRIEAVTGQDRKSTRLNSSSIKKYRITSLA